MKYLAIYGLITMSIGLLFNIGNSSNKGGWRILGVLLNLPLLIFFLAYLHII